MKIACDLFTSSIKFQVITKVVLKKIKKNFPNIEIVNTKDKKFLKKISTIDIYWGNRIDINLIKKMANLKWIHYGSTGVNSRVLEIANKKKIIVTNTRRFFDEAVASTVLAFIFMMARGINFSFYLKNNKRLKRSFYNNITENIQNVFGEKILFVGFGGIAKKIAKICKAMNMEVFAIKKNKTKIKGIKLYSIGNLKKAAKGKNYIVNLLPYTKETKKIFDIAFFSQMDKNSFFINAGRGETVNEVDLVTAIKKKLFLGAALDVVENEPIQTSSRLLKFKNIIVTPHIAGITNDYWVKQYDLFFNNLKKFKRSVKLQNVMKNEIGY